MGDRHIDMTEQILGTGADAPRKAAGRAADSPGGGSGRGPVLVVAAAFAALCAAVLVRAASLMEPDDYAYRASIVALTQGHWLSLTNAQYQGLLRALSGSGGMGIAQ